jgi:hypothetical protein
MAWASVRVLLPEAGCCGLPAGPPKDLGGWRLLIVSIAGK